jgi:hypothetical protein
MTPENQKILTYTGIGAALIAAYFLFFNNSEKGTGIDPTGNGNGGTLSDTPTFNAKNIAEELYNAMREMGTDTKGITQILTPVNRTQFAEVFKAFGKRTYNDVTGNQYQFNPFVDLPFVDLKGWMYSELSQSEYSLLKLKYPNFL